MAKTPLRIVITYRHRTFVIGRSIDESLREEIQLVLCLQTGKDNA